MPYIHRKPTTLNYFITVLTHRNQKRVSSRKRRLNLRPSQENDVKCAYSFFVIITWLGLKFLVLAQDVTVVHSNVASVTFAEANGVSHTSFSNAARILVPAYCSRELAPDMTEAQSLFRLLTPLFVTFMSDNVTTSRMLTVCSALAINWTFYLDEENRFYGCSQ